MADNRRYYYLKLKEDFFDTDDLVVLESMPDGYMYSNILLKLFLRSLKNEGRLMFRDRIPYNSKILSQITRHAIGVVEKAIQIFEQLGLIEVMDNGAIYMLDIQNYIGESNTEADRKRAFRNKIEKEKNKLLPVGQMSGHLSEECPLEIEIELEKEIDLELEKEIKGVDREIYKTIIEYLNDKTNKNYKHTSKSTKRLIDARLNEGFKLEDFTKVIDIKVNTWLRDPKMNSYLRPETLFGTKFDGYLNEEIKTLKTDYGW